MRFLTSSTHSPKVFFSFGFRQSVSVRFPVHVQSIAAFVPSRSLKYNFLFKQNQKLSGFTRSPTTLRRIPFTGPEIFNDMFCFSLPIICSRGSSICFFPSQKSFFPFIRKLQRFHTVLKIHYIGFLNDADFSPDGSLFK